MPPLCQLPQDPVPSFFPPGDNHLHPLARPVLPQLGCVRTWPLMLVWCQEGRWGHILRGIHIALKGWAFCMVSQLASKQRGRPQLQHQGVSRGLGLQDFQLHLPRWPHLSPQGPTPSSSGLELTRRICWGWEFTLLWSIGATPTVKSWAWLFLPLDAEDKSLFINCFEGTLNFTLCFL